MAEKVFWGAMQTLYCYFPQTNSHYYDEYIQQGRWGFLQSNVWSNVVWLLLLFAFLCLGRVLDPPRDFLALLQGLLFRACLSRLNLQFPSIPSLIILIPQSLKFYIYLITIVIAPISISLLEIINSFPILIGFISTPTAHKDSRKRIAVSTNQGNNPNI